MKNQKGFVYIILILVIAVVALAGAYYFGTFKNKPNLVSVVPTPTASQAPTDDMSNWKTYTNYVPGITLKYPNFYNPTEKFLLAKVGQPVFIVTGTPNFISSKITLCKSYVEDLCLIPGKNWNQTKDILPTTLSNRNASSFFIMTKTTDGGSNVIHIIQTTEKPFIEIALTVDGQGGEEMFDQILSTFKFTK